MAGKSREAENSREAEKRRSREIKKLKSREAKKQGKTEKQENREAKTDSKKQKTTPEKICSLICGCSNAIRAKAPACLCRYIIYFDTFSSTQVFVEYCIESGQSQNGWFKDLPQNQSGARATIKKLKPENIIQLNICKR